MDDTAKALRVMCCWLMIRGLFSLWFLPKEVNSG